MSRTISCVGGSGEGVPTLGGDLHEVVGQVTVGQIETEDGVRSTIYYRCQSTESSKDSPGSSQGL